MLQGTERKIVFWYDDDAAYAEDISQIQLSEGNKLWMFTDALILLQLRVTVDNNMAEG